MTFQSNYHFNERKYFFIKEIINIKQLNICLTIRNIFKNKIKNLLQIKVILKCEKFQKLLFEQKKNLIIIYRYYFKIVYFSYLILNFKHTQVFI